ncbi:hypothetical protein J6590_038135 [Homalodisca vitripennis]|nr:hypothetical protein J6590_038135 [Homalodisca vitripennis]
MRFSKRGVTDSIPGLLYQADIAQFGDVGSAVYIDTLTAAGSIEAAQISGNSVPEHIC